MHIRNQIEAIAFGIVMTVLAAIGGESRAEVGETQAAAKRVRAAVAVALGCAP